LAKKKSKRKWFYLLGAGGVGASTLNPDTIDIGAIFGGFLAIIAACDILGVALKNGFKMVKPR
jgi:hypothetical protein